MELISFEQADTPEGEIVYVFTVAARPWTVNSERASNRFERAKKTKLWRGFFADKAALFHVMRLTQARVEVALTLKGQLQDTAACMPAVKAAIDGMVDGGMFEDDTGEHVESITFHAPERSPSNTITVTVIGFASEPLPE